MSLQKIIESLSTRKERVIELHSGLTSHIAMSATNGGDGEWEKAAWYEEKIRSWGLTNITHYDAPDATVSAGKRPNLCVRVQGESERTLWVIGHFDVVPAGNASLWDTNPFELTLDPDGDTMYGRGVEDNQQAIVAATLLAAELIEQNVKPKLSFALLCVADEETNNQYGIDYILEHYPNLVHKDDLLLVPDFGTTDGKLLEIAEKGVLWLKITVHGKQCHASTPIEGINALSIASEMICQVDKIEREFSDINPLFTPSHTTITPTRIDQNVPNANTISGHVEFYLDCRIIPHYSVNEITEFVKKHYTSIAEKYNAKVDVDITNIEPSATPTSVDSEIVQSVMKAIKKVYDIDCTVGGVGGSTVAGRFRNLGIPAAVWARVHPTYHMPNEKGKISNNIGDAQIYANLIF